MELLKTLGINKDEALRLVVERAASKLLTGKFIDEDGNTITDDTPLHQLLQKKIKDQIDEVANRVIGEAIGPRIEQMILDVHLQRTNQWGEKKGEPITFTEYVVHRAEKYMTAKVSWDGLTKEESRNSLSWKGQQTRIAYLINRHIHNAIEQGVKATLKDATSYIAQGLAETTRMKLTEAAAALKIDPKITMQ